MEQTTRPPLRQKLLAELQLIGSQAFSAQHPEEVRPGDEYKCTINST